MESKVKWVKLGPYIEQLYERNTDNLYDESDAIGVNIDKVIRPMKGHLENKKFDTFFVVRPKNFVYNPRGSRKLGLGYNDTDNTCITTFNNVVFHIKDYVSDILPEYLFLILSRKEWDRQAEYMSWGSSTEVFTWSTLCEVKIPLPSPEEQQKVVNVWKACREIKEQNEAKAAPLMQLCQSYIQELKHKYPAQEIGPYIEECTERNYTLQSKNVRGVSTEKEFRVPQSRVDFDKLDNYKVVYKNQFVFVPTTDTWRCLALCLNKEDEPIIVSPIYCVFSINQEKIIPEYLHLYCRRKEIDRYARFHSWGSARENFNFPDMQRLSIPIPPLDVQRAIVNIYKCANEAKQIAAEADRLSREVCPALLQHIIHN